MALKKVKRRVRFWSLKVVWPLLPVIIILGLVGVLARARVFSIKEIDCRLDNYPCSLVFEPVLVGLHGKNIFTLKNQTVSDQLKNLDPAINAVTIQQRLPNKLIIAMERKPALAKVEYQGSYWQLDAAGNLFLLISPSNTQLPLVRVTEGENLTTGVSQVSFKLAAIIQALNAAYVHWNEITWLSGEEVVIATALGPQAVINPSQPIEKTIATLQYILANLKIGEKLANKIDLRFDQPVLSF